MLFIDLDGVLATYISEDFKTRPFAHEIPNRPYFKTLPPIPSMVAAVSFLLRFTDAEFAYLSTVGSENWNNLPDDIYRIRNSVLSLVHAKEKAAWLQHYGLVDEEHPLLVVTKHTGETKPERAMRFLKQDYLRPTDVLVDDFKKNLNLWAAKGGTPIKFLNNVNDSDDLYASINQDEHPTQIAGELYTLATMSADHPVINRNL